MTQLEPRNPFPGPQPYRGGDRDNFHGRDAVGRELVSTILAHRSVALFGPSGAGKSSLMQALVMPTLDADHEFRRVFVDSWPADEHPVAWLADTVQAQLKLAAPAGARTPAEVADAAIKQAFRRSDRPILVYLDQLEQLLLPQREAVGVDALLAWLDRLAERPTRGLHLVLSMREDYLGRFRDRARGCRRLLEDGFRLGPLTVGELAAAVCRAAVGGAPPQAWAPAPMKALMMQVRVPGQSASDDAEVQTAFAQIVCRAVFADRAARGDAADADVLAEPILQRYLGSTLAGLGPLRAAAERLLEEQLVAADGTRTLLTEEAARAAGLAGDAELDTILGTLERAAILRAEQHRGTRYFELGHDWLARKIHEDRQARLARAAELAREQQRLAQQRAAEAQVLAARAETRRARRVVVAVTTIAAVALAASVFAWTQRQQARLAEQVAETRKIAADDAKAQAERDRADAETSRDAATKAQEDAEKAASAAKASEQQEKAARASADRSLVNEKLATAAARRARTRAEINRRLAEQERRTAEASERNARLEATRAHDAGRLANAIAVLDRDPTTALAFLRDIEDPQASRDFARVAASAMQRPVTRRILGDLGGPVIAVRRSPDGRRVAAASQRRTVLYGIDGAAAIDLGERTGRIVAVAWSPDSRRVAVATAAGAVRVSTLGAGANDLEIVIHAEIHALAWTGETLVVAAGAGQIRRYHAVDGREQKPLVGHTAAVRSLSFSPTGDRLATTSDDGTARVWSLGQVPAPLHVLNGHTGTVNAAAFSPAGDHLATAGDDRTVRVWRLGDERPRHVLDEHTAAVNSVEFSSDGEQLVTAASDRTARLWTLASGASEALTGHDDKVYEARFAPDGVTIATASRDGTARLWPIGNLGAVRELRGHRAPVVDLDFSYAGNHKQLITAAEDGGVRVWDVVPPRGVRVLDHNKPGRVRVRAAAFAAGARRLVTAAGDGIAHLWGLAPSAPPVSLRGHGDEVLTVVRTPGNRWITGGSDGKLRVWSDDGARVLRTVPLPLGGRPEFIALDARGRRAMAAVTDVAIVVDLDTGKSRPLSGHRGQIRGGAFDPTSGRSITTSDDTTARIWPPPGPGQIVELRGHGGAVLSANFSPDGQRVVTASWDRTACIWQADSGAVERTLRDHSKPVRWADWSPDGSTIVTASDDGTVKLWSVDVPGDPITLVGHQKPVRHAVFSPDRASPWLATSSDDGTTRVWHVDIENPGSIKQKIRDFTAVTLTPEQQRSLLGETPDAPAAASGLQP